MTPQQRSPIFVMLAVTCLALSGLVTAQEASMLDVSEATGFMGEWVLEMETPRGKVERNLALTDVGGKVAAVSGGRGGDLCRHRYQQIWRRPGPLVRARGAGKHRGGHPDARPRR